MRLTPSNPIQSQFPKKSQIPKRLVFSPCGAAPKISTSVSESNSPIACFFHHHHRHTLAIHTRPLQSPHSSTLPTTTSSVLPRQTFTASQPVPSPRPVSSRSPSRDPNQHSLRYSYSSLKGTISISGGEVRPRSCSQALILRSLSSHALHTPPPKTRVCRRQPSAVMISPDMEDSPVVLV
jgi:hypothetical protein